MDTSTTSVGYELVEIPDAEGRAISKMVMYPTTAPEAEEQVGPFTLDVAHGAPPSARVASLVLISHGSGGTPATHRELARYLASRGLVVGMPAHPGNHRSDNSLDGTFEILRERPRHLRAVADWFFSRSRFASLFEQRAYSVVGHSIGAYTGLALAGGTPTSLPHQHPDRVARVVEVEHDPRVTSLVLLAPATPWFRLRGSLERVRVPILMVASYHDALAPYFVMCPIVEEGVADPRQVDCRLVEGASHYSFLSPWPESMRSPAIPPSQDPPGFDRRAFLDALYPDIAAFLLRTHVSA
jgi:predicted dienelactone hydrolase